MTNTMMDSYKLIGYQLVKEEPIRDAPIPGEAYGDIIDWKFTVIAESKTIDGIVRFARMKKLNENMSDCGYIVESAEREYFPEYPGVYEQTSGNLFKKSLNELL